MATRRIPGEISMAKVSRRLGSYPIPCVLCGRDATVDEVSNQVYVHVCKAASVVSAAPVQGCSGPDCLGGHRVCAGCQSEGILPDGYFVKASDLFNAPTG